MNPRLKSQQRIAYTITINKADQTLTAANLTRTVGDGSIDLSGHAVSTAGANSGAITYAVTTPGAGASISGTTLSYTTNGTATITATAAGSANYNGASTTFTLTVAAQPTYTTTITVPQVNGNEPNTGAVTNPASVTQGTTVNLPTVTARAGFTFSTWTVTSGGVTILNPTSASGASFVMGASNVLQKAKKQSHTSFLAISHWL